MPTRVTIMARMAAKTATYSAMHMAVAIAVAWANSGDWRVALGIGLIEPAFQTVAYTIHERAWTRFGSERRILGTRTLRDGRAARLPRRAIIVTCL